MAVAHQPDDWRELSKALLMPFQLAPLLFVAITSLLLGMFLGGGLMRIILSIFGIILVLVWITQYALGLIDDAANGVRESQAASAEMAATFNDARAWVHPTLAVAIGAALMLNPQVPRLPVIAAAAVLFPASVGACAITGHALAAINPFELARVMRGMGRWYPVLVLFVFACALAGVLAVRGFESLALGIAVVELGLLLAYAGIGGALYVRRHELDFEPRRSPERIARQEEAERHAVRQGFFDDLYKDLRVRDSARATGKAANWLRESGSAHLRDDLHALLEAGKSWNEPREYPRMLRGLLPVLTELRQPTLALNAAEAGLAAAPTEFCPETEALTATLAEHAMQTGRRRSAARLVENYLRRAGAGQPAALLALQQRIEAGQIRG